MSDSVRPHRRLAAHQAPGPWDSPGKNTGVGYHFLLQCMKVKSLSRVRLSVTPWTAAYQAPPSMGFSRQEYWSGVPLPSLINSLCTSISKKQPSQIGAQDLNGSFSTEDIEIAMKHMKRCSASESIRELRIKSTLWHHPHMLEWSADKIYNNKCWRENRGERTLLPGGGNESH